MSRTFESYASIKRELFNNDKNLKREYDALAPRYELISKAIDARLKKKMTQEEVAERMGTTKSSISRFESGNYNPTIDFLIRLSNTSSNGDSSTGTSITRSIPGPSCMSNLSATGTIRPTSLPWSRSRITRSSAN